MGMEWINKNAKYFVIAFGLFFVIGMIFMGPFDFADQQNSTYIGKVNGEVIPLKAFGDELNYRSSQQRTQTGQSLEGLDLVQFRKNMFKEKVQLIILEDIIQNLGLSASKTEMWDHLESMPFPALRQDTNFQTNGQFDQQKYLSWIHDDATIKNILAGYEAQMKQRIIPVTQLQQLTQSQSHNTSIEQAYQDFQRQNKATIKYYFIPKDSFVVTDPVTDAEIQAYYESKPDSFYAPEPSVKLGYIKISLKPSTEDTTQTLSDLKKIKDIVQSGESFEEMAIVHSADESTAENGGSLGGLQSANAWVPEFSKVAFSLKVGEISDPVKTQFGYHIIRCNNIAEDSVKKVDVSHILLKVEVSSKTIDKEYKALDAIKESILNDGSNLKALAEKNNFSYLVSPTIYKGDYAPFGERDYVSGIHSYAFGQSSEVSNVLQNKNGLFLFETLNSFPKGRSLEREKDNIKLLVKAQKQMALAVKKLTELKGSLPSDNFPAQIDMAKLDSTRNVSLFSWVAGVGFNSLSAYQIFNQPLNKWGNVIETDFGVVIAMVQSKESPDYNELLQKAKIPASISTQLAQQNFGAWMELRESSVEVENNLDNIYTN